MTSLGVALAVDSRGPSGLYIITDSRLTSSNGGIFDAGQKAFASSCSPDIFGFCGDAFLPPAILRQAIDQISSGVLFSACLSSDTRHKLFVQLIRRTFSMQIRMPIDSFSMFHGARDGALMESKFRVWRTVADFDKKSKIIRWFDEELLLEAGNSYFAHLDGSGGSNIAARGKEFDGTSAARTSRAAIWSFCNALNEGKDRFSGGAPQLVGIWRKGDAKNFGFFWKGKPYVCGAEASIGNLLANVDWFNHRFERCDWRTGKRLLKAARHRDIIANNL